MYLNCRPLRSPLRHLPIEKLVAGARKNNVKAMALTDINNSTGMMDFISEYRLNGIRPIAGMGSG
jgi:DNA polymerase III alpha subunit